MWRAHSTCACRLVPWLEIRKVLQSGEVQHERETKDGGVRWCSQEYWMSFTTTGWYEKPLQVFGDKSIVAIEAVRLASVYTQVWRHSRGPKCVLLLSFKQVVFRVCYFSILQRSDVSSSAHSSHGICTYHICKISAMSTYSRRAKIPSVITLAVKHTRSIASCLSWLKTGQNLDLFAAIHR